MSMRCIYCLGTGSISYGHLGHSKCDCGILEFIAGMRALASLMYWVYWTPTTLPHDTDWRDVQGARYYSIGVAIECGLLPPGLEWTS